MTAQYYSHGKLLLSGEYVLLDGAKGLAIPTVYGQHLRISTNTTGVLNWTSLDDRDQPWFKAVYDAKTLQEHETSDSGLSTALLRILREAQRLQPTFLAGEQGYTLETALTFPKNWGLGSSSTLINNMANWAGVDPFDLLKATFGGSGYDIACARHDLPILYQLRPSGPHVTEVAWDVPFREHLYFVYLNQKQNSRDAIAAYRKLPLQPDLITKITTITEALMTMNTLAPFEELMGEHERLLSEAMGIPTVKERLFPDYAHSIKSLGAWGGDFILATGSPETPDYFTKKGYDVVIPFSKMIL